jgi:AcrR family transcriptional regulator
MTEKSQISGRPYAGIDAEERRSKRREAFIDAGLESFGTLGYARSTIQGICRIAGLTQRYFYESFTDKEDLLVAVYRKLISDIESEALSIIERPGITPEEAALMALRMFFRRFRDDPRRARVQLFEVLGVSPRVDSEYRTAMVTLAEWARLLMIAVFPEISEKWKERNIIHSGAAGAIIQIANQWVLDGLTVSIDDMAEQAIEAFIALGRYYVGKSGNR